jgi:drug/metabolite transporter (DMT)-like permease
MSRTLTRHRLGFLLVTASAVAWSLGGLFTRLIPLDNWTVLAWRGLFGAIGLAAAMVITRQRDAVRSIRRLGWRGWSYVVQTAGGMILYITALKYTTVAHVAIIYATAPFMAAGLGWMVLRERPSRSSVAASVVALGGVIGMMGFSSGGFWGELAAFGTTASMAVTMVVARNYPEIPIMPAACLSSLLSGVACRFFATPLAVTHQELSLLALFGIVNFSIGLPLFTWGARLLPAIETALIGAVDAPLAPLWVWLAFGEAPSLSTILGGSVVFIAVAAHLVASEL